jgi:hypothetical protein
LPGAYTARLTVSGKIYTATFIVRMDPRVTISTAALEKKFQIETRLASLLSETSQAALQTGSIRDSLQKLSEKASGPAHDSVQAFQNRLTAVLGSAPGFLAPVSDEATLMRVNGQIYTLYGQVWQADAEPTISQSAAVAAAERDVVGVMDRWRAIKTTDLPALNHSLRNAKLPEVQLEVNPHADEGNMDEE